MIRLIKICDKCKCAINSEPVYNNTEVENKFLELKKLTRNNFEIERTEYCIDIEVNSYVGKDYCFECVKQMITEGG